MNKICKACKQEFDISLFDFFTRKSGKIYILHKCKSCNSLHKKEHYINNKNTYKENNKIYVEKNRSDINLYHKIYNKENYKEYYKKYFIKNKIKINENRRKYIQSKLQNDSSFKLRRNVSKLISSYLKRSGYRKNNKSILNNLGYSIDTLKVHLEKQFEPWMTWNNWGKYSSKTWNDNDPVTWRWQIDHIIPQSNLPYTSIEESNFKKCWELSNLRPYSAKLNLLKGNK